MLPTVTLPSTRTTVEDFPQPVQRTTQVLDALSEFVPGQKLLAEVQAQLANGAYRAIIGQRDVTLALPFSAKAGDSLELEVVETDGKIAFAVSRQKVDAEKSPASATTTLSRTGQLIARLLAEPGKDSASPAVLNEGRVLLGDPAASSKETAATLQQAVAKSGLFYESHQAAWLGGRLSEAALRSEPQAVLALALRANPQNPSLTGAKLAIDAAPTIVGGIAARHPVDAAGNPIGQAPGASDAPRVSAPTPNQNPNTPAAHAGEFANPTPASREDLAVLVNQPGESAKTAVTNRASLPPEIAPLVQQQLSGLASNIYSFQGMAWAGQPIFWEIIDENQNNDREHPDEAPRQWKTRLKMLLPALGDIDATVQLDGNDVSIRMTSGTEDTLNTLKSGVGLLQQRMELAGLRLFALDLHPLERTTALPDRDEPTTR